MGKSKKPEGGVVPLTIPIPGGQATFFSREELPPARERELQVLYAQLNPRKIKALQQAARILDEDGAITDESPILDGPDAVMNELEARLMFKAGDLAAWAYLESWTLRISDAVGGSSEPRPLPASAEEVLQLPRKLYDALTEHAAKFVARDIEADKKDGFDVGSVQNQESPTTA